MSLKNENHNKLESLLSKVNFYRKMVVDGAINKNGSGYKRLQDLENKLESQKNIARGRRISI